jgi:voltage-gated potassium channel
MPSKRLFILIIIFTVIIVFGTIGYSLIEEWSFTDSFYMAVITVTTVGFGEVYPLSNPGRLFTAVLIVLGVGAFTYTFGILTDYIIAGELSGFLKERKMKRLIESLRDHYIVCGYGEMGHQICLELARKSCPIVIIDNRESAVARAHDHGFLAVLGDAGMESVLRECGIERAAGIVVATDVDATNLLVVVTARLLKPQTPIVARANLEEVSAKLQRAGANRVLVPQAIVGRRMAQMLLHPEISDFMDVITHDESLELILESLNIDTNSGLVNLSLAESKIRERTGASIVGLKRPGQGILASVDPNTVLRAGDTIFALGTREQVESLADIL